MQSLFRTQLACLVSVVPTVSMGASWNQYAGSEGNARYASGAFEPLNFDRSWSFVYEDRVSATSFGGWDVAVSGDSLYVVVYERYFNDIHYSPTRAHQLLSIDLTDGSERWRHEILTTSGIGEPTVLNGSVFVNRGGHSFSHVRGNYAAKEPYYLPAVIRLDSTDGQRLSETNYPFQHGSSFRLKPAGDSLIAASGYYGGVEAFSATGASLWYDDRYLGQNEGHAFRVAASSQNVWIEHRRVDPNTGDLMDVATHPDGLELNMPIVSEDDLWFHATTAGQVVIGPVEHRLSRYVEPTGVWVHDIPLNDWPRAVAVNADWVVVGVDKRIEAFDRTSGAWLFGFDHTLSRNSQGRQQLVVTDDLVFAANSSRVYAFDPVRQRAIWSREADSADIAVSDGYLLVSGRDRLDAYRLDYLTSAAQLMGDVTLDARVDQADLNIVLNNWGTAATAWYDGDLNGDGWVRQGDLNAVLNHWGDVRLPDTLQFAVPEPAFIGLIGSSVVLLRRRNK